MATSVTRYPLISLKRSSVFTCLTHLTAIATDGSQKSCLEGYITFLTVIDMAHVGSSNTVYTGRKVYIHMCIFTYLYALATNLSGNYQQHLLFI